MRLRCARGLIAALLCLPFGTHGASATGNFDCAIDDKHLNFEFFGLTGGTGGIVQVSQASIEIKTDDDTTLKSRRDIALKDIEQQWIYGNELRLRFAIPDAKGEPVASLILIGTRKAADDSYPGRYVLTIYRAGGEKEFKGKMKCG